LSISHQILEVAEGMAYLHSRSLLHGDLKSVCWILVSLDDINIDHPAQSNVLIDHDGHVNIADAGLSAIVSGSISTMTTSTRLDPMRWMAPELFAIPNLNEIPQTTPATDVYSFSLLCLEVRLSKRPCFVTNILMSYFYCIALGLYRSLPLLWYSWCNWGFRYGRKGYSTATTRPYLQDSHVGRCMDYCRIMLESPAIRAPHFWARRLRFKENLIS
jgi:serine/threonine protein kinase